MVVCLNCGKELAVESTFCPDCSEFSNLDYPKRKQGSKLRTNKRGNIFHRLFRVLFDNEIQADISFNNYNFEAIFLFILIYLLDTIPLYRDYLAVLSLDEDPVIVLNLIRLIQYQIVLGFIIPLVNVAILKIGNVIAGTRNSFMQIFRLYMFMSVPLSIVTFGYRYYFQGALNIILSPLEIGPGVLINVMFDVSIFLWLIIMPLGFRTLFNCSYIKAFIIYFITILTYIPGYAFIFILVV